MAELTSILFWSIGFLWAFCGMYVLLARAQSDAKYPDVKLPQRPDGGTA